LWFDPSSNHDAIETGFGSNVSALCDFIAFILATWQRRPVSRSPKVARQFSIIITRIALPMRPMKIWPPLMDVYERAATSPRLGKTIAKLRDRSGTTDFMQRTRNHWQRTRPLSNNKAFSDTY